MCTPPPAEVPLFSMLNTSMENAPSTVGPSVKPCYLFSLEMASLGAKAGLERSILLPPPPRVEIVGGCLSLTSAPPLLAGVTLGDILISSHKVLA